MTVQTLRNGRSECVLLPKKDYARLQRRAGELTAQDLGDIAESKRRLASPGRSVPLSEVRKRLGP
jgi:PHD/YefM family antitoxin component YafN of YafNO toxin-antitoxin module